MIFHILIAVRLLEGWLSILLKMNSNMLNFVLEKISCDVCGKRFSSNDHLVRHRKRHLSNSSFACDACGKSFTRKDNLLRHSKQHLQDQFKYVCSHCNMQFNRLDNMNQHIRLLHQSTNLFKCLQCDYESGKLCNLKKHVMVSHSSKQLKSVKQVSSSDHLPNERLKLTCDALNTFLIFTYTPSEEASKDLLKMYNEVQPELLQRLEKEVGKFNLKWYVVLQVRLNRIMQDLEEDTIEAYFRSTCTLELSIDNIPKHIEEAFNKISVSFEEFIQRGSGWTMDEILKLELHCAKYYPLASK